MRELLIKLIFWERFRKGMFRALAGQERSIKNVAEGDYYSVAAERWGVSPEIYNEAN